ncbi:unnamed protein product [Lactuca saligna]|uniref:Uncharacterized protein n=1 Tax=Lactuca saligna TaxID=75948 RepID=A0AA35YJD5_LACSI|nr:unnamed protein product [Lactuca saligna]
MCHGVDGLVGQKPQFSLTNVTRLCIWICGFTS